MIANVLSAMNRVFLNPEIISIEEDFMDVKKLTGRLDRVYPGDGFKDVTVGGKKIRAWETIKGGDGVSGNPAFVELQGVKVGDTVEATYAEKQTATGTFANLLAIARQDREAGAQDNNPVAAPGFKPRQQKSPDERREIILQTMFKIAGEISVPLFAKVAEGMTLEELDSKKQDFIEVVAYFGDALLKEYYHTLNPVE